MAFDYFTKWVKAISLKDIEQSDVINFIEEHIVFRFRIPKTITIDKGTIFTSRKWYNMQNIEILSY